MHGPLRFTISDSISNCYHIQLAVKSHWNRLVGTRRARLPLAPHHQDMETEREVILQASLIFSSLSFDYCDIYLAFYPLLKASFILCDNLLLYSHQNTLKKFHWKWPLCFHFIIRDRMYGALTGLSKQMVAQRHGLDTLKKWRRGYANRPPPISSFSNIYPGESNRHCCNTGTVLSFNYYSPQL